MANIVLDDNLIKWASFSVRFKNQRYRSTSMSFVNTSQSNGARQLVARATLFANDDIRRDYLIGVIQAAAYSYDTIEFTPPTEFYRYIGTAAAHDIVVHSGSNKVAGSNQVKLAVNASPQTFPTNTNILQGGYINFENDTTLYTINNYVASTGVATIFPLLRKAIETGDTVEYQAPKFTGRITNIGALELASSNNQYCKLSLTIEEDV